ncbi:gametocyte-specific factor 1-like [Erinaceus europaeus]|uniref:Gametocyte-specific factor 1-like n=1 Tax=Erinaceus europaeus TaxID=9365 RepID=A0A1S2ZF09_ERIEU|nr:gametocyte-specific factor 1-like [Erinaceus europaeus]
MDPEVLEVCPYDPNHRMPASRLQYHLASCKKKNPKIAKKMANCKYNACHVVPIKRLKEHEANCVNRTAVDDEPFNLPKVTPPSSELNEQSTNTTSEVPDHDAWNIDNLHHCPSFVLKTFAPKMLVCESDLRDIKKETMDDKFPSNDKYWRKAQGPEVSVAGTQARVEGDCEESVSLPRAFSPPPPPFLARLLGLPLTQGCFVPSTPCRPQLPSELTPSPPPAPSP